jgi:hypothetical protein
MIFRVSEVELKSAVIDRKTHNTNARLFQDEELSFHFCLAGLFPFWSRPCLIDRAYVTCAMW